MKVVRFDELNGDLPYVLDDEDLPLFKKRSRLCMTRQKLTAEANCKRAIFSIQKFWL